MRRTRRESYRLPVILWTAAHFLVDLGCALMLSAFYGDRLSAFRLAEAVVVYDMVAFVLQLPFGLFLDLSDTNVNGAICALGAAMAAIADFAAFFAGGAVPGGFITAMAVFAGLGNACFHVGAGTDVLRISGERAALPGIFVSAGAMGLFLGSRAAGLTHMLLALTGAALLLAAAAIFACWTRTTCRIRPVPVSVKLPFGSAAFAAALFTLVIVYRSYLGFMMKYSWKAGFLLGFLAAAAAVLGKAAGGIIGDAAGWGKTMAVSLAACALLAVFSEKSAPCGIAALFLFNMTMPITMTGLACLMPDFRGAAFGINTAALFAGFVWSLLDSSGAGGKMMSLQILLSLGILLLGLSVYEKKFRPFGRRRRR